MDEAVVVRDVGGEQGSGTGAGISITGTGGLEEGIRPGVREGAELDGLDYGFGICAVDFDGELGAGIGGEVGFERGGGGGVERMWEGELCDCFDDSSVATQTVCALVSEEGMEVPSFLAGLPSLNMAAGCSQSVICDLWSQSVKHITNSHPCHPFSPSCLLVFTLSPLLSFLPSRLHSFAPSFLLTFSSSLFRPFSPSCLLVFTLSPLLSFLPSRLHSFTPSLLLAFSSSLFRPFSPSCLLVFTLSPFLSFLPSRLHSFAPSLLLAFSSSLFRPFSPSCLLVVPLSPLPPFSHCLECLPSHPSLAAVGASHLARTLLE
ncbi:unnamed protein product [Closterium sp. Naga37s-1]|nr:unnamed protein product [Closterium sp. Naga37s-1]